MGMSASANARRPKTSSQNFMRRSSNMQYAAASMQVPKTRVNRSTNNMYEQFQHRPMTSPYHPLHVDMADNDNEYESSSSDEDSSASSDESTKNGEGEEESGTRVLTHNR